VGRPPLFSQCSFGRAGNKKKLEEVVAILEAGSKLPFTVLPAKLDLPELQGEPEEIAAEKCRLAAAELQAPGGRGALLLAKA
jgi:inosine/xanthosine triphosphate pyrophosphatase family protein